MQCYKGFDKDLKCRGFQYEVGKTYETDNADICRTGFHACENPLDVFGYYPPADSRFCMVDLDENSQTENDSKRVGKRIHIETEIGLQGIISAGVKFILDKVDFSNVNSNSTNTGDQSAATNTGDCSAATNTGDCSAAVVNGTDSIAIVTGRDSKAKGSVGCWLVLTERDDKLHIKEVRAVCVDGKDILPDTFYMLVDGKVVPAD